MEAIRCISSAWLFIMMCDRCAAPPDVSCACYTTSMCRVQKRTGGTAVAYYPALRDRGGWVRARHAQRIGYSILYTSIHIATLTD